MNSKTDRRMRDDWNSRAREDAKYYVAFGRRSQDDDEFFATADEMVNSFESELKHLPGDLRPRARRALEIGCGLGRLMRPLSRSFGEIHGVDVSDEMVRLAREQLADIPHAHVHHTPHSDLRAFADDSFDFVYSYAVFQHIPDADVVYGYFHEIRRVLKEGGFARFQFNGLPRTEASYDTWSGVRLSAEDVAGFARDNDFQLLALEGHDTQYMWTTWRKRPTAWVADLPSHPETTARLRRITNSHSSEPIAPTRGRFAAISLWIENLPGECDLNQLAIRIGGVRATATYIGPPAVDGLRQLNAYLPAGLPTGLAAVEVDWRGHRLAPPSILRIVPPGPSVPRVEKITDGVDLLSGKKIASGLIKVIVEEVERPEELEATIAGVPVAGREVFCTDPRVPKHEINFRLPRGLARGPALLEMTLARRRFAPVALELA